VKRLLSKKFYARDVVEVALDLLGREVRRDGVTLRITEVEAYDQFDSACHAFGGLTTRNAPLWGPAGRAYVYLCYGLHNMLNVVADEPGRAAAVLIRSCEPLAGQGLIEERRGGKRGPVSLTGPGKVGQALALDTSWSDHVLYRRGGLTLHEGEPATKVLAGPRVGIDYASAVDRSRRWRFAVADSPWVSQPGSLRPIRGRIPRARAE
jgi:DNA-3-methyladenine glycosylase